MNKFKPNDFLVSELEKGVPIRIRSALLNYFREDRGNKKRLIEPAIEYTKDKFPSLFQQNNVIDFPMNMDKNKWDSDYFNLQLVYSKENFSKERLEHLITVGMYLYPEKTQDTKVSSRNSQNNIKKNKTTPKTLSQNLHQKNQRNRPQKQNKNLLMLSVLIIAIIIIVVIVIFMNNNQNQAMIPLKNQIAESMKIIDKVFPLKL
jgi:ATP-dependent Zn protease